jgi:L-lactate permease
MSVWFGFKSLQLPAATILQVGFKSAAMIGACSFVIAPAAASFLVPWRELASHAGFVLLSIASAVVPTVLLAVVSAELPVVVGECCQPMAQADCAGPQLL